MPWEHVHAGSIPATRTILDRSCYPKDVQTMPMSRIPNYDELADLLGDEEIRNPSARAQMLDNYMGNPPSVPIVRSRPVGNLVIEDLGVWELVPL